MLKPLRAQGQDPAEELTALPRSLADGDGARYLPLPKEPHPMSTLLLRAFYLRLAFEFYHTSRVPYILGAELRRFYGQILSTLSCLMPRSPRLVTPLQSSQ